MQDWEIDILGQYTTDTSGVMKITVDIVISDNSLL